MWKPSLHSMASLPPLRARLRQWIQNHRRHPVVRAVAFLARNFHEAHERPSYGASGGEVRLLRCLAEAGGPWKVVFDVGANRGHWTKDALPVFPAAEFHLFEIAPPTARHAMDLHRGVSRVHINTFGLAEVAGHRTLNYYGATFDELSTLRQPIIGGPGDFEPLSVEVRTGDGYLVEQGIDHIDFLKIDAEGSDFDVLRGFDSTLRRGAVRALQFEYTGFGTSLRAHHQFLAERGYKTGKLFSRYVEFFDYSLEREDLPGPNYVAVHQRETALIAALAAGFRR